MVHFDTTTRGCRCFRDDFRLCRVLLGPLGDLDSSSKLARFNFFAPTARSRIVEFQTPMTSQFFPSYGRERALTSWKLQG